MVVGQMQARKLIVIVLSTAAASRVNIIYKKTDQFFKLA